MKIDYNHLQNHFDTINQKKGLYYLVDKKRIVGQDITPYVIAKIEVPIYPKDTKDDLDFKFKEAYCEWWRKAKNRDIVKDYFVKTYGK